MRKWWVIGSLSIIMVIGVMTVIQHQVTKVTQTIMQQLSSNYSIHLQPQDLTFSYFPLSIQAKNISYQQLQWQISADQAIFDLSYLDGLSNNQWLKQIQILNAKVKQQDQIYLDKVRLAVEIENRVKQKIKLISAESPQLQDLQGEWVLRQEPQRFIVQQLNLQGQLRKPIAQLQKFDLTAEQIEMMQIADDITLQGKNVIFNQNRIPELTVQRDPQQITLLISLLEGQLQITQRTNSEQQIEWALQGRKVPASFFSGVLGYNPIIAGYFDLHGNAMQTSTEWVDAELNFFSVGGGQIKGFNLLGLLGNALPFPITGLESDMQDTDFEHIEGQLQGNPQQWRLQNTEIVLHDVRLIGKGDIYPTTSQCEWQFVIQPTKLEYAKYHLNMDLDGNCFSPTYRIHLDDAIKNKLKSKLQELLDKI
ncbi:hypothetical protein ACFFHT_09710 [Gallibacterium melopsittaci]|uniref:AsmA-like C-terminal domain-containing protein n=1 Tax=Gallibacterium melopsittaci TaxID=516063 RepID=A0ABV6HY67_9PAST